jgi:RHS repeat-associated protein
MHTSRRRRPCADNLSANGSTTRSHTIAPDSNRQTGRSQTTSTTDPASGVVTSTTTLLATPLAWNVGYDSRNRITSFSRLGDSQSFAYDANGNRTSSQSTRQYDTDLDGGYESSDRTVTTQQTWTIDPASNRLTALSQQTTTTRSNAQGNPVSTQVNAQASYPADAAGNLTTDGLRKFEYDSQNRHSKTGINDADEGAKAIYLHNAAGQRVFKSEPQVDYTAPTETTLGTDFITWLKTNFKWLFAQAQANASLGSSYSYGDPSTGSGQAGLPSWALLGEYSNGAATGSGRTEYIWLPVEDGSGNAIPIAMFRGSRYYAIHSDHLGTPRLMTDDAAKPVWQWPYSAFGETKPTGILTATTNPNAAMTAAPLLKATSPAATLNLRYPGQYFDSETNLFYNSHRTYDPMRGSRYTQADPIGLEGGWNRFGYVGGNALGRIDPRGLFWFRQFWQKKDPLVGREGTFVEPGGPISTFVERYIPAGRTMAEVHDALVDKLTSIGIPDSIANIPTMIPSYGSAIGWEVLRSIGLAGQPQPDLMCPR